MIDIKIVLGGRTYEGQVLDVTVPDPPPPPPPDVENFSVWSGNRIPSWVHGPADLASAVRSFNPYPDSAFLEWWVKVGEGGSWQAQWDPHPMCPGSKAEMVSLVQQMAGHGIRVVPWVVLRGRPEWSEGEYEMIRACVAATGVCALNLENGEDYWNGPTDAGQVGEWLDRIGVGPDKLWLTAIPRQSSVNALGGNATMAMWLSKVSGCSWECYDTIAPDLAPDLAIPRVDAWEPTGDPWKRIPLVQRSRINAWANTHWASHALQVWHLDGN